MQNNIGQMMAEHLYQTQDAIAEINRLKQQVNELQKQMAQLNETGGDQGWMAIRKAAGLVGMTKEALAQRFRRGVYPEGVVWNKQNQRYVVNLHALREYMSRGDH